MRLVNHLNVLQDKSTKFNPTTKHWNQLSVLLQSNKNIKNNTTRLKRLRSKLPTCILYQQLNTTLNKFLCSKNKSDDLILNQMRTINQSSIFPRNEIIARFIKLLAKKQHLISVPQSEQQLVESLYTKATLQNLNTSNHLKLALLKYVLMLPRKAFASRKYLPSDILSSLPLTTSTAEIIIPHTSYTSLFTLVDKLPRKTLCSPVIQLIILRKIAAMKEKNTKDLIMMRFIAYLSVKARVTDEALKYTRHPLSFLLSDNKVFELGMEPKSTE